MTADLNMESGLGRSPWNNRQDEGAFDRAELVITGKRDPLKVCGGPGVIRTREIPVNPSFGKKGLGQCLWRARWGLNPRPPAFVVLLWT